MLRSQSLFLYSRAPYCLARARFLALALFIPPARPFSGVVPRTCPASHPAPRALPSSLYIARVFFFLCALSLADRRGKASLASATTLGAHR